MTERGIGASALASRVSSVARHFILDNRMPTKIVGLLNTFIHECFDDTQMFLTFVAAPIYMNTRTLTYSSAGHPSPLLMRRTRRAAQSLIRQNPLLGV